MPGSLDITVTDIRIQRGAGAPGSLERGEPDLDESDNILRIGLVSGMAVFRDKIYVDAQDAATLASAEDYADTGDAATLSSAQSYADAGDATTLASANDYTDAAIAAIPSGGGGASSRVYNQLGAGLVNDDNTIFVLPLTTTGNEVVYLDGDRLAPTAYAIYPAGAGDAPVGYLPVGGPGSILVLFAAPSTGGANPYVDHDI